MIQNKIKPISEALGISESTVSLVLYSYLANIVQDILVDGKSDTLFGKMYLDKDNQLQLERTKFGLIELLDKKDLKEIYKICCHGPNYSIF